MDLPDLAPDERLLWQGAPETTVSWRETRKRYLVIGVVILGFYGYALMFPRGPIHPIQTGFNLAMLIAGAVFVWFAIFGKAYRYARTRYAITDRRVIKIRPTLTGAGRTDSYAIGRSTQISRTRYNPRHVWFSTRSGRMVPLRDLAEPDRVATLLREATGQAD